MSAEPHAFISYVREDSAEVDRLCRLLENANIPYWRDRKDLGPGDEWKAKIRDQIRDGSFVFLACFSENYHGKPKSTMNEELTLAVEEFRKMVPGQPWIIPIRFADVDLPPYELRAGLMLSGLNYVSLFGDQYAEQAVSLTSTVTGILGRTPGDPAAVRASVAGAADEDRADLLRRQTKDWILDATRRIALSDLISDEARRIRSSLGDETRFPLNLTRPPSGIDRGLEVGEQVQAIWELTAPFLGSLNVAVRWGETPALDPWKSALRGFCLEADSMRRKGGIDTLLNLRHLPVVASAMTVGFAAVRSQQWGNVKTLLTDVSVPSGHGIPATVLEVSTPWSVFDSENLVIHALARAARGDGGKTFEEWLKEYAAGGVGKQYTPVADWMFELLRPVLDDGALGEEAYAHDFDVAEVMLGIVAEDQANQRREAAGEAGWYPLGEWYGRSARRARYSHDLESPVGQVEADLARDGAGWAPLRAGLFEGEVARARSAVKTYREEFDRRGRELF